MLVSRACKSLSRLRTGCSWICCITLSKFAKLWLLKVIRPLPGWMSSWTRAWAEGDGGGCRPAFLLGGLPLLGVLLSLPDILIELTGKSDVGIDRRTEDQAQAGAGMRE